MDYIGELTTLGMYSYNSQKAIQEREQAQKLYNTAHQYDNLQPPQFIQNTRLPQVVPYPYYGYVNYF